MTFKLSTHRAGKYEQFETKIEIHTNSVKSDAEA